MRGDAATCCGGVQRFIEGCHSIDYNGAGLVIEGHKLSCGHYAISSCAAQCWIEDHAPGGYPAAATEPAAPAAPLPAAPATGEAHWLDLRLTDNDQPLPGHRYLVTDATGQVLEGQLDDRGCARVSPVAPGPCRVDFPELGYSSVVQA